MYKFFITLCLKLRSIYSLNIFGGKISLQLLLSGNELTPPLDFTDSNHWIYDFMGKCSSKNEVFGSKNFEQFLK